MSDTTKQSRRLAPSVIAIGIAQIIGWGTTFNLPGVIGTSIARSFNSGLDVVLLGPTIMLTVLAAVSWWIAPVFERVGARLLMIVGALIMASGLLAISLAPSVQVFLAARVLLGVGGAGALSTAAQIAMQEIFGDRARQAIGAMSLVSGLSNTIMWPLTSRLDNVLGWRTTLTIFAVALVLIYVPIVATMGARKPRSSQQSSEKQVSDHQPLDPLRFVLVAAVTALNGFITWGFSLTLIPLLMLKGLDNGQAVALGSALGVIQIAARAVDVVGGLTPLRSAILSTTTMLFSFVLLYLGSSVVVAGTFILLYGLAGGLMAVVRATLPLTIFPPKAYARAAAKLALPLNLSFAAAPPVFARILEGHGPNFALSISIVLSTLALASLAALTRLVRRQDQLVIEPS